jgi:hypothetical protein
MKTILVALFLPAVSTAQLVSPDGKYEIRYIDAPSFEANTELVRKADNHVYLSTLSSSYESSPFEEVVWSTDSKFLAVAIRGSKTTSHVEVYKFSSDEVTQVSIPQLNLNLLGRHQQVKGGRYFQVSDLKWQSSILTFTCRGSLVEGVSNPLDLPEDWFNYKVSLSISDNDAVLTKVAPSK